MTSLAHSGAFINLLQAVNETPEWIVNYDGETNKE